jgi:hypothetical protein
MMKKAATSSRPASTVGDDSSSAVCRPRRWPSDATFAQLCAILATCLHASHGNVTDAKDLAARVLAKRQLKADVPMIDRAIAAVLTSQATERLAMSVRQPHRATLATAASHMREGFDRVDWRKVVDTLKATGLLKSVEGAK